MSGYPMARWWVSPTSLGASVWTKKIERGGGGGYYLYGWECGSPLVTVEELLEAATTEELKRPVAKRSTYVQVGTVAVPRAVHELEWQGQEIEIARLIFADARERFGEIAEWITYDNLGKPVWFHSEVVGN